MDYSLIFLIRYKDGVYHYLVTYNLTFYVLFRHLSLKFHSPYKGQVYYYYLYFLVVFHQYSYLLILMDYFIFFILNYLSIFKVLPDY